MYACIDPSELARLRRIEAAASKVCTEMSAFGDSVNFHDEFAYALTDLFTALQTPAPSDAANPTHETKG